MWTEWIAPSPEPLIWVIASTLAMYLTVILLARWSGVRSFAQMSTFDIAVTIAIGSLVANTAVMKDPPLIQGITALVTLYCLQLVVSRLRKGVPWVRKTTDNPPILLMGPGGQMKHANMQIARITEDDLRTHLRQANVADRGQVQAVVMEGTGRINVLHGGPSELVDQTWILADVRDYCHQEASD